jgi:exodeoxyribonuclease III
MESFVSSGFIDSFRYFNNDPHHYTWWSNRPGVRDRNLGWRIDYNMITQDLEPYLKRSAILCDAKHSDHCPVLLELAF